MASDDHSDLGFQPDAPVAANPHEDLGFTPDQPAAAQPGLPEALLRGGLQGATFGFGDKMASGADALIDKVLGTGGNASGDKSLGDLYSQRLAEAQAANAAAQKAHPIAYGLSTFGGGALTGGALTKAAGAAAGAAAAPAGEGMAAAGLLSNNPALASVGAMTPKIAAGAARIGAGALGGAAAGIGYGNPTTLHDGATEAVKGALTGGTFGTAAEGLGAVGSQAGEGLNDLASRLRLNATGATAKEASNFTPDVDAFLKSHINFGSSAGNIADNIQTTLDKAEQIKNGIVDQLPDVKVDRNTVLDYIRAKIKSLSGDESQQGVVNNLKTISKNIQDRIDNNSQTVSPRLGEDTTGVSDLKLNYGKPEVQTITTQPVSTVSPPSNPIEYPMNANPPKTISGELPKPFSKENPGGVNMGRLSQVEKEIAQTNLNIANAHQYNPYEFAGAEPIASQSDSGPFTPEQVAAQQSNLSTANASGYNPYSPDIEVPVSTVSQTGTIVDSEVPLAKAEDIRKGFDAAADWDSGSDAPAREANRIAANAYRQANEEAIASANPDLADQYKAAKTIQHNLIGPANAAARRAGVQAQNPIGGLNDMAASLVKGTPAVIARRTLVPRLASSAAVGVDALGDVLKGNPEALGPWAKQLLDAQSRGGNALGATNYILFQTSPEYRDKMRELFDSQ